nr:IS110 family transposase [Caldimonas brevitalea]
MPALPHWARCEALNLAPDPGAFASVVNPLRVNGFAQSELMRNKNDRADAQLLLARFCSKHAPERWVAAPAHVRHLRALVDRLQILKDMVQQESNRLEALDNNAGLRQSIDDHIQWLKRCMVDLQRQIDDHIDGHADLREDAALMQSIPGLGPVTVAKVLAYLGDVRRFGNAKALAAFLGVTPRQRQSGTSIKGRTILNRTGHAAMRTALYMPAIVAMQHNQAVKAFGDRLRSQGMAPKAVIGACMHKLALLIFGVVRSRRAFDVSLAMPKLDFQDGI